MGILGSCVYQCFCNFIDSSLFNGWISISNYNESADGFRGWCDFSSNECFNCKMGPRRRKINYFINYLWRNFVGQEILIVESWIAKKFLYLLKTGLLGSQLEFLYSEKATKFSEIFPLLLFVCTVDKSKGKIFEIFCGLLRIYEL